MNVASDMKTSSRDMFQKTGQLTCIDLSNEQKTGWLGYVMYVGDDIVPSYMRIIIGFKDP